MNKAAKFVYPLGCWTSIVAPLLAIVLYPRAKWLFAFTLIGVAVLVLNHRLPKDPTPQALADQIERLLKGDSAGWDVENFEFQSIRNPQLREFHLRSMKVGGLPEGWINANEERKKQLREIIEHLRNLEQREGQ
jgi:hypothetical protein